MIRTFGAIAATLALYAMPAQGSANATEVEWEEAQAHLLTEPTPLRRQPPDHSGIQLRLAVAPTGEVLKAEVIDGPAELRAAAVAQAKTWRYEPFVRDGKPVSAVVDAAIPVYAPEAWGPKRSFPRGDPSQARIRLERSACLGTCPAYSVWIFGDGAVVFEGKSSVILEREIRYRISRERAAALIDRFRAADFYSARDSYRAQITDHPTYAITFAIGGEEKRVEDYVGLVVGMPRVIADLELAIDEAAQTARFIRGDIGLLHWMHESGIDLKGDEAAHLLARVVHLGSEETVTSLLEAGLPPYGEAEAGFGTEDWLPAAAIAARDGKSVLARRLIASGAFSRDHLGTNKSATLRAAATALDPELVRDLIALGADVNASGGGGLTALMSAARSHRAWGREDAQQEIIAVLISAGSDVDAVDENGRSALFEASRPAVVQQLAKAGANLEIRAAANYRRPNNTPLCDTFSDLNAALLIRLGARTDSVCWDGRPAGERFRDKRDWPLSNAALRARE